MTKKERKQLAKRIYRTNQMECQAAAAVTVAEVNLARTKDELARRHQASQHAADEFRNCTRGSRAAVASYLTAAYGQAETIRILQTEILPGDDAEMDGDTNDDTAQA